MQGLVSWWRGERGITGVPKRAAQAHLMRSQKVAIPPSVCSVNCVHAQANPESSSSLRHEGRVTKSVVHQTFLFL